MSNSKKKWSEMNEDFDYDQTLEDVGQKKSIELPSPVSVNTRRIKHFSNNDPSPSPISMTTTGDNDGIEQKIEDYRVMISSSYINLKKIISSMDMSDADIYLETLFKLEKDLMKDSEDMSEFIKKCISVIKKTSNNNEEKNNEINNEKISVRSRTILVGTGKIKLVRSTTGTYDNTSRFYCLKEDLKKERSRNFNLKEIVLMNLMAKLIDEYIFKNQEVPLNAFSVEFSGNSVTNTTQLYFGFSNDGIIQKELPEKHKNTIDAKLEHFYSYIKSNYSDMILELKTIIDNQEITFLIPNFLPEKEYDFNQKNREGLKKFIEDINFYVSSYIKKNRYNRYQKNDS